MMKKRYYLGGFIIRAMISRWDFRGTIWNLLNTIPVGSGLRIVNTVIIGNIQKKLWIIGIGLICIFKFILYPGPLTAAVLQGYNNISIFSQFESSKYFL